jgi:hypothetical protein
MLPENIELAPASELVRYLAIFQRAFVAIENYTRTEDKAGMLLGGWIADALHNVPGLLINYSPDAWYNPVRMDEWMHDFPEEMEERELPPHLVRDCRAIFARAGTAQELQLQDDLSDIDIAPPPKMRGYLTILYHACLGMRLIRRYGHRSHTPWKGLESLWTDEADERAEDNSLTVQMLCPLPKGLVHWSQFDEARFRQAGLNLVSHRSLEEQEAWANFLDPEAA